jgi:putative N6-adenine-specific DNA methylase
LAKSSIKNSGAGSVISLNEGDCIDWDLEDKVIPGRTIFVCNPPWGVRLTEDIDNSWVSLREFLRREASGAEAWVLSGNKDLTKILRMKTSRKVVVKTAEEDLRWLQYHIFQRKDAPILKQTT